MTGTAQMDQVHRTESEPAGLVAGQESGPVPAAEYALAVMEATLRAMFGRPVGSDENFFDAGLTSATLVELHLATTRDLPDPFPVTAMFAYPNLRALRRYVAEGEWAAPTAQDHAADGGRLRRIGSARREMRKRIRTESERP
jgi:hypothetical protein